MKKLCGALGIFLCVAVCSQTRVSDSLYAVYKNASLHDTIRLRALQDAGWMFGKKNPDTAIVITELLLKEARAKSLWKFEAAAYSNLGVYFKNKNEYPKAQELMTKALNIRVNHNDLRGIAVSYNGLGSLYSRMSDFPRAIDCFLKNISIYEALNEPALQSMALSNIGNIYFRLKEFRKAVNYNLRGLEIKNASGDKETVVTNYINLCSAYYGLKSYDSAMYFVRKAIPVYAAERSNRDLIMCYQNLGDIYYSLKISDSARYYFEKSLDLSRRYKDREHHATCLLNLANLEYDENKIQSAKARLKEALSLLEEIGDQMRIQECYECLYLVYRAEKNYKEALLVYEKYITGRDSLFSIENQKAVMERAFQYDLEKKSLADSLKRTEERKLSEARLEQEKTKRFSLYGGLGLFALFGAFMYNRYRVTRNQKKIIEQKEKETNRQKEIIQQKQTEILDSMYYAKRIQGSLMTGKKLLEQNLKESFVYFLPKDIVSGDFYWAAGSGVNKADEGGLFYLAVCDSTGHGVPGAMMSMLNISCLNEAVNEKGLTDPGEILNYSRTKIISALTGDGSELGGNDGMDGVLCCFDLGNKTMTYAAANNSIYIARKGDLLHLSADKMPVGRSPKEDVPFRSYKVNLEEGDMVYLFSDGFADQFGGPKQKKFKYRQFETMLLECSLFNAQTQEKIIEEKFRDWKGPLEQIDDVCLVGIRV